MTNPLSKSLRLQRELPVGVFDSGLGGLTVVRQLFTYIPDESILYFGDTARLPYGTKSAKTVRKFSLQIVRFLQKEGVKMIVVACNTASSLALDAAREAADVPIVGVIESGARAAIKASKNKSIGIIGTTATISSGAYENILNKLDPEAKITSVACPLFVSLVEEGWSESVVAEMVTRQYLEPVINIGIDTLILGCTHYPILKAVIQKVVDTRVRIIDSSLETAKEVRSILDSKGLYKEKGEKACHKFYVSDRPQRFEEIAECFLGEPLPRVNYFSFDDFE